MQVHTTWGVLSNEAQHTLRSLVAPNGHDTKKRRRSSSLSPSPSSHSKKPKLAVPSELLADDPPVFTLHAVSTAAPVRKKVDITIRQHTLRFTHPTTHAVEASLPLSVLRRAFLLPSRGKAKPHWTVILMSSDVPDRPARGAAKEGNEQVVFGMDATAAAPFTITTHPSPPSTNAKGTSTRDAMLAFLGHLPASCTRLEPSIDVFRSASTGSPGIAAYRGAKDCSLWFFRKGILSECRPCEFWALEDLDGGAAADVVGEAIRLQSATGRTCSVFVRRKPTGERAEDGGLETEFGMVDGREQENIKEWVRMFRGLFGRGGQRSAPATSGSNVASLVRQNGQAPANDAAGEEEGDDVLDSDDEGSDFEMSGEDTDGGSPSTDDDSEDAGSDKENDAGSGDNADHSGEEGESMSSGQESGSEGIANAEDEGVEEEELDPKHHPLLRAGAVPRMSRAAMDAAVGMAMQAFVVAGQNQSYADDDEEDELDE